MNLRIEIIFFAILAGGSLSVGSAFAQGGTGREAPAPKKTTAAKKSTTVKKNPAATSPGREPSPKSGSNQPANKSQTPEEGLKKTTLPNGLEAWLMLVPNASLTTLGVVYKVGSRNETPDISGATHLIEHLMFKSTSTVPDIAKALQESGARFNGTTSEDHAYFWETMLPDKLEPAIQLEADRMRNLNINDDVLQSTKSVVLEEIRQSGNSNASLANKVLIETAFGERASRYFPGGTSASLEAMTSTKLKSVYDSYYRPNNAAVIVVGNFDRATVIGLLQKYFGAHPAKIPIPTVNLYEPSQTGERRQTVQRPGAVTANVTVAFHIGAKSDADTYALEVLAALLARGSTDGRLNQELRENKGYTYGVHTFLNNGRDPGLFVITLETQKVNVDKVEESIIAELRRVTSEGVSPDEVERSKQFILVQLADRREKTLSIAQELADLYAAEAGPSYETQAARITAVTASDIQRVAQKYLRDNNRTVLRVMPD